MSHSSAGRSSASSAAQRRRLRGGIVWTIGVDEEDEEGIWSDYKDLRLPLERPLHHCGHRTVPALQKACLETWLFKYFSRRLQPDIVKASSEVGGCRVCQGESWTAVSLSLNIRKFRSQRVIAELDEFSPTQNAEKRCV
jgi:hypothetical protein